MEKGIQQKGLEEILKTFDIDFVALSDEKGQLIVSAEEKDIGFNPCQTFDNDMDVLEGRSPRHITPLLAGQNTNAFMKFITVPRKKKKGIIQFGFDLSRID